MKKHLGRVRIFLLDNGIQVIDGLGREVSREMRNVFGSIKPLVRRDLITKEEIIRILHFADLRGEDHNHAFSFKRSKGCAAASLKLKTFEITFGSKASPATRLRSKKRQVKLLINDVRLFLGNLAREATITRLSTLSEQDIDEGGNPRDLA